MDNVIMGFSIVLQFSNLLMIIVGVVSGIIIGALPGLSATMGVVLLLPLTFSMGIIPSLMLLLGVYCGAVYGGSITAILIRTPGTPAAAATVLDGYEFAKRGEGGRAIGVSTVSSAIGSLVSCVALLTIAPILSKFALQFSAAEYFALAVFGLTIIGCVSGKSVVRGLLAGVIGLIVATVGIDNTSGTLRYTMGSVSMLSGFSIIPAMIGLFALPQVIMGLEQGKEKERVLQKVTRVLPSKEDFKKIFPLSLIFGTVGTFIGAVPGTGATIASFLSYNEARRWSKHPEKFGTGVVEGIIAPESANNGVSGGALIPLLTLGVPGDVTTAVLLGAFLIQGLQAGPMLFTEHPDIVYSIFTGMFVINIVMLVAGLFGQKIFIKIVSMPNFIIVPMIFILCVVGSFAINNSIFDVGVMFCFGLFGYVLNKLEIPEAPVVIGLILGPLVESSLRRALILSKGSMMIFIQKPISAIFLLLSLLSMSWPYFAKLYKARMTQKQ
jgi:putative tricarboxylic transport membrane protein